MTDLTGALNGQHEEAAREAAQECACKQVDWGEPAGWRYSTAREYPPDLHPGNPIGNADIEAIRRIDVHAITGCYPDSFRVTRNGFWTGYTDASPGAEWCREQRIPPIYFGRTRVEAKTALLRAVTDAAQAASLREELEAR